MNKNTIERTPEDIKRFNDDMHRIEYARHYCLQCGSGMNPAEWIGGAVCMKCCRANHKSVTRR